VGGVKVRRTLVDDWMTFFLFISLSLVLRTFLSSSLWLLYYFVAVIIRENCFSGF
jgi:hypothetical protein